MPFGVQAVPEESLAAVRTSSARTHTRQDHLVTDGQLGDAGADLGDDADTFVAQDAALLVCFVYFAVIGDLVNIVGPLFGLIPAIRNLILIKRSNEIAVDV